ncbi:recombinase RecT [Mycolicibacter heraklionensis]|uniref:recombinase RecT n=1 Tax=Mycolicibacter heraklionensis TaxID=512402 RepID=UPI0006993E64|nr:recombinase RecT [Mycolicibacter heraklionensis]
MNPIDTTDTPNVHIDGPGVTGNTARAVTIPEPTTTTVAPVMFGGRSEFTPHEIAMLRQIGVEDAEPADLDLFFHICQRTGLDPFARQIYMIGRETDVKVRVQLENGNSRVETQRMMKFTIQTGIDGYRLIGERAARAFGDELEHDDPMWRGKPGSDYDRWLDYWPESAGQPAACRYTIRKNGRRYTATCNFNEYVQYKGSGEMTSMWKKMGANQIAKCTEAQAWRKAYPADFSGVILEDAAQPTVIDADIEPPRSQPRKGGRGLDGLRDAVADDEAAPAPRTVDSKRADAEDRLAELLTGTECRDRREEIVLITALLGEPFEPLGLHGFDNLTDDQIVKIGTKLAAWEKAGRLADEANEVLNAALLATEDGAE